MRIEHEESTGNCSLVFERRDKDREQLIPIRGLFNALGKSFGGISESQLQEINEFLKTASYQETIEKVEQASLNDDPAFKEFISLDESIKKIVIRRLYAVVTCYCKGFTY
jgi:hypothetical protein